MRSAQPSHQVPTAAHGAASRATLQINLAPSDHRYAALLLPHQLRQWSSQVDEVLLCVDLRRSKGRFGSEWELGRKRLFEIIEELRGAHPGIRVTPVDYGEAAARRIGELFFGGRRVSEKDVRGGPYYSYFFGLAEASHDFVLHTDSDMFFGGGSTTWLREAAAFLTSDPSVVTVSPLPGPPTPDGQIIGQPATPIAGVTVGYEMRGFSTRTFVLSRTRFVERVCPLRPRRPAPRAALTARLRGNPVVELPEETIARQIAAVGCRRVDFLGAAPGMWSLHPPYRSPEFLASLPELVRRVEAGEMPDAQRGYYDVGDALVDWSSAREALRRNAWWRRLARRFLPSGARPALIVTGVPVGAESSGPGQKA